MKYISVTEFIEDREGSKKEILHLLRDFIIDSTPDLEEKIAYNVPFYYYNGPLLYLSTSKKDVYIGFCKGYAMNNYPEHLLSEGRKEIKVIHYKNLKDIDFTILNALIQEAVKINEEIGNNKL